ELLSHFVVILLSCILPCIFFFFRLTPTPDIYTLSLHDALPIYELTRLASARHHATSARAPPRSGHRQPRAGHPRLCVEHLRRRRSEEHTSELQSLAYLVCRLLLEKKKSRNAETSLPRQ